MNDVNIIIGTLLTTIVGLLVLADWQALHKDTCQDLFESNQVQYNAMLLSDDQSQCLLNTTFEPECLCELPNTFNEMETQCFWNPASRITGKHCSLCRKVCLNKSQSLTVAQLIPGIILIAINYPILRFVGTTLATSHFGKSSQVITNRC